MTGASHERRAPVVILSEVLGPCRPFGQLCTACAVLLHGFDNRGGVGYHHLPPPREVVGREGDAGRTHRPSARHGSAG